MSVDESVIQKRLEKLGALQQEIHQLKDEHGGRDNVPLEEYRDVFRRMVELVAGITRCPSHGFPEEVTAHLSGGEDDEGFDLELEGLCCEELRSEVDGKLQQLAM